MNRKSHDIFSEAIELSESQRDAYVTGQCNQDQALEDEVRSLLKAHQQAGDFLIAPTANMAPPPVTTSLPEPIGTVIDRYKLLECIGEGGFGVVYMAQQTSPVRRRVALKIIRLGMDTKQVVARFEAERQALALMDHPNIAGVLDGGATESARPYFVMELVRGEPITTYCDKARLNPRARLELFQQVCKAIQHAHQKGIIHRDIKPSNVLVAISDGRPLVKIIDFGIAKATSSELTEKTMFTEFRQVIGTPQYMSPEQAESTGSDVDTRSDVYSLGVLLYEMLTGRTPIDPQKLRSCAWHELQRVICDEEPTKPSTLVSLQAGDEEDRAARRATEPARLRGTLKGDLDWILLKSLEKDRSRRYDSASEFSKDILRYLSDEPVEASPPSVIDRLSKFSRRNRALLFGTAAVLAALILGIIGTTAMAISANRARNAAVLAEAETAKALSKAQRASVLAGASLILPETEARELARQWQEDLQQQRDAENANEKLLVAEETSFATWYGNWLWANGNPTEASEMIKPFLQRASTVLGDDNPNFMALANANVVALVQAEVEPIRIAKAYEILLSSIRAVRGRVEATKMLPECAAAFAKAKQNEKAAQMIRQYLDERSRIAAPLDAIENLRLDKSLDQLALWGKQHSELFNELKRLRETGTTSNLLPTDDLELAKDIKTLQGHWSWKRFDDDKEVEHMMLNIDSQSCVTSWLDPDGKVLRARNTRFELSRSGGAKVFKSFLPGAGSRYGAFIYHLEPDEFVLVRGMLANEPSLPGTDRQAFTRISRTPEDKPAKKESSAKD